MHLRDAFAAVVMSVALAAQSAEPSDFVRTLRGSQMGVDRSSNLWSWDGATLTRLNALGQPVTIPLTSALIALDADEALGVVAL